MRGRSRAVAVSVLLMLTAGAMAGCAAMPGKQSTTAATANSVPGTRCGTARTAAGVPVEIDVTGQASCRDAMAVERAYAHALASGKVRGNGGGAPVLIHGWVCQGYDTPRTLATGRTSACRKQGMQILALLVLPSPGPSATS